MIDKPGIYQVSAADYHADPVCEPSLSASVANVLLQKSPAHARLAHPRLYAGHEAEESDRFDLGTAAHALLLERDDSNIVWVPHNDWRTAAARTARIDARAQGKLPILSRYQGVLDQMCMVARQAINDSEFCGLWDRGQAEQTIVWREGDVWCRSRADWLSKSMGVCLDYKSTEDASPETFSRQIPRMNYHVQGAFYKRGLAAVGVDCEFILLAQEVTAPFSCSVFGLSEPLRQLGESAIERAIAVWQMCTQSGLWPAYSLKTHFAEAPAWMLAVEEARLAGDDSGWN